MKPIVQPKDEALVPPPIVVDMGSILEMQEKEAVDQGVISEIQDKDVAELGVVMEMQEKPVDANEAADEKKGCMGKGCADLDREKTIIPSVV